MAHTSPSFTPYIPANTRLREFTARAVVVGSLLGIIFGASSLYLALKVGLTVSASIPVAVISVTLFRLWAKLGGNDATILEHNIAQTAGSAGESLAFGAAVTMPAILILGFDLEVGRVLLVAVLGGLLGILLMIPLRRPLIVQQHGELKYPEGTACAEVLKAGANDESRAAADPAYARETAGAGIQAKTIFGGFALGLLYKFGNSALKLWKEAPEKVFGAPLKGGSVSCEISPEMVGVGYIIGPRIAGVMAAGGVLSYLVLIPLIQYFGGGLGSPLAPGKKLIADLSPNGIRSAYLLYIGAGAVAAGGLVSLLRSMPTLWRTLRAGLADLAGAREGAAGGSGDRRDRDLSLRWVAGGVFVLMAAITLAPSLHMNLLGAALILVLGFLFVTVSSRLTGEVGSSSNPISGMTIATLLLTCLTFVAVGWTGVLPLRHRAVGRRHRLHRLLQRRHHFAGPQDRVPRRRHAAVSATRHPDRSLRLGPGDGLGAPGHEPRGHGPCPRLRGRPGSGGPSAGPGRCAAGAPGGADGRRGCPGIPRLASDRCRRRRPEVAGR